MSILLNMVSRFLFKFDSGLAKAGGDGAECLFGLALVIKQGGAHWLSVSASRPLTPAVDPTVGIGHVPHHNHFYGRMAQAGIHEVGVQRGYGCIS
jgi:hypothetical protein